MSSSFGNLYHFTIFGQSHSAAVGVTVEGLPAGFRPDMEALSGFLSRRAPGGKPWSTARSEADEPEFVSGLFEGRCCGAPLTALIRNTDTRSRDYSLLKTVPRPGHADYTAFVKYGGFADYTGGGHFSGRLTAPLCIAGGLAKQVLGAEGIRVMARIASIGPVADPSPFTEPVDRKEFPAVDDRKGQEMQDHIASLKERGDSCGGVIECVITGLPAGLGGPLFGGMEGRIAQAVFGVPAVKGIEFGEGFGAAGLTGSANNDAFCCRDGRVETVTNHCGGILGGITDGMPLVFRAAVKPTPSIAAEQRSVDLAKGEETALRVPGRHDPCIVPRAVPCIEAAAAAALLDALLERRAGL